MNQQTRNAAVADSQMFGSIHVMTVGQKRLAADIADNLRKLLKERINNGAMKIVVDLSKVDFIDSLGIGAIVAGKKSLKDGGELVLAGANRNVLTMFKLTRLDKEFQILNSRDEAVQTLST